MKPHRKQSTWDLGRSRNKGERFGPGREISLGNP